MDYFIISGEASGDIHGGELITSLRSADPDASFRFLGGDKMAAAAGHEPIIHYRDMAFMGFIEVAKHLKQILGFMRTAKQSIKARKPDALILIDYPSFNLKMAEHASKLGVPVFYFISPKVWAWKEHRVKSIKRWVDAMYCILPFETDFYSRHGYAVEYVGNPTVAEIGKARKTFASREEFCARHHLPGDRPLVALVPGSRKKEIRDNLPTMARAARLHPSCQAVVAAAPGIDDGLYREVLAKHSMRLPVLRDCTFELVAHSIAALVTSGTATLETALLGTPQVAMYRMNGSKWVYRFYSMFIKGKYVTLPNLITDSPVIPELLLHHCSVDNVDTLLTPLLTAGSAERDTMLEGYVRLRDALGNKVCTEETARAIVKRLAK